MVYTPHGCLQLVHLLLNIYIHDCRHFATHLDVKQNDWKSCSVFVYKCAVASYNYTQYMYSLCIVRVLASL